MGPALSCVAGRHPEPAEVECIQELRALVLKPLGPLDVPRPESLDRLRSIFAIHESADWKVVCGFQNVHPLKDIRGGGFLAITNLEHFFGVGRFAAEATDILRRRRDRVDGRNYPVAAAGINLTLQLARPPSRRPP